VEHPPGYADPSRQQLYDLLFAEHPADFAAAASGPLAPLAGATADVGALNAIAADRAVESRLRRIAYRRLREAGQPPAELPLLGVVVEVALEAGLDTLAAYADGSVRYINHAGGVSVVEPGALDDAAAALVTAAGPVVAAIGPWEAERLAAPPQGSVRLSFLVGDRLYFGQGPIEALAADPLAGPVLAAATALLGAVVGLQQPR